MEDACRALAKWIDLSSSVAFRMRNFLPTANTDLTNLDDEGDIVDGTVENKSLSVTIRMKVGTKSSSNRRKSGEISLPNKKKSLEAVMQRRIPILGSVTVSCRTELYHDLLSAQISSTDGRYFSNTIFNSGDGPNGDNDSGFAYELTSAEHIDLILRLCEMVVSGEHSDRRGSSGKVSATLQTMRRDLRFHVLQYILGLDERWSFEHTVSVCSFVRECIEAHQSAGLPGRLSCLMDRPMNMFGPFRFIGRKSRLLSESTMNVLARGMPQALFGLSCSIRYSLIEDGASLMTLVHASKKTPYEACLVVVEDAVGYVFGGFINEPLKQAREFFGSSACFVFCAMPNTKLYSATGR